MKREPNNRRGVFRRLRNEAGIDLRTASAISGITASRLREIEAWTDAATPGEACRLISALATIARLRRTS